MALHITLLKSLALVIGLGFGCNGYGQTAAPSDSLSAEILRMDSVVFTAFNTRNVEAFSSAFAKELEFYHDKGGLTDYNHTLGFMKQVAAKAGGPTRTLVPGSSEVYPIPGYGAMQIGAHRFCVSATAGPDCGTFKFVHIWKKTETGWQITRVVSYGH